MKDRSPKVNVIVTDNGSTDETVSVAKAHDVDVVEMGTNSGFGAACNAGARAGSAPVILLLNPDALTTPSHTLRPTCQLPRPSGWPAYQHLHDQGVATTDGIHPILVQQLPRPFANHGMRQSVGGTWVCLLSGQSVKVAWRHRRDPR